MFKLFIGYQAKETTYCQVKCYLLQNITSNYFIKKNKNKGKKKPNYISLTLYSFEDMQWLIKTDHTQFGFELSIQPFMTKEERRQLVQDRLTRRVYINGIPDTATEEEIKQNFAEFGDIEEVFFKVAEKERDTKTLCYVTFVSKYGMMNCLDSGDLYYEGYLLDLFLTDEYNNRLLDRKATKDLSSPQQSLENKDLSIQSPDATDDQKEKQFDWMGEKKGDTKLTISKVVLSGIRRPPYEVTVSRNRMGRVVKSNIRYNRATLC
jgi:hypothetical protein